MMVNDCLLFMKVCLFNIDPVPIAGCTLTCIIAIVIGMLVFALITIIM